MKTRKEFISELINCKDIEELFECLSSAGACMNYQIWLIKREGIEEGCEEYFIKEIKLKDFLTEWVGNNEAFFVDDDIKYLIDLIRTYIFLDCIIFSLSLIDHRFHYNNYF